MGKMKREQGINDLIQPEREKKRCSLDRKNGVIRLLEFLCVSSRQGLGNLLFVGEELIERTRRNPGLGSNMIGSRLVVAQVRKDGFSRIV
jgi:hypothetical protein